MVSGDAEADESVGVGYGLVKEGVVDHFGTWGRVMVMVSWGMLSV